MVKKEIDGKEYEIKEIPYLEGIELNDIREKEGTVAFSRKVLQCATDLSDEQINSLSMRTGLALQQAINEVNALDFQEPTEDATQS